MSMNLAFRTPDGEFHHGEVALDEGTTNPRRGSTTRSDFNERLLALIDAVDDVNYGYLMYSIDDEFTGFDTQGFARQILSTAIACTMDWLSKHPSIEYLVFTGATKDGTNNRPRVYRALAQLMAAKYGFKAFSEPTGHRRDVMFALQVR